MPTEEEKKQQKLVLHGRIWLSGFIATAIFTIMMLLFDPDRTFWLGLRYFLVFYAVWVIAHYVFLRKHFKFINNA